MPVNRFWSSVGSVLGYLAGIGLLQYILVQVGTGFGLLPEPFRTPVALVVSTIVPVVGTMYYLDWRWSWKGEHIGLSRSPGTAASKWLLGFAAGVAGALIAHVLSESIAAQAFTLTMPDLRLAVSPLVLVFSLLQLFVAELIFRGAAISRLQADLSPQEVLLGAPLIPIAWFIISRIFRFGFLPMGIEVGWDIAATLFVTLLFLRTDSVWLSAGLRMGFAGAVSLLTLGVTAQGGNIVWGIGALILLVQEWTKLQRAPKRMQQRGRTTRGPWGGPH
ncbi:MAG TPA: CPBP family glutamic-type intramembrane protease [Symbiobacteriaceae bacterium]|nr:CPBP family glutamic-type intramembrane protease [Symbiobacteriaceae bacterium]